MSFRKYYEYFNFYYLIYKAYISIHTFLIKHILLLIKGDRATGYGVSLLTTLFGDSSTNSTVKSLAPTVQLPLKNNLDNDED